MISSPAQRLADLRAAQIVELPTPRRRDRARQWAVLGGALALAFAAFGVSGHPLYLIVAVVMACGACGWVASAREIDAQLRAGAPYEAPSEWDEAGTEVAGGAVNLVMSGGSGLLETGVGLGAKLTDRLWRRTNPWRIARYEAAIAAELEPGERRLVSCVAASVPHGWRRVLLWATLGIAWPLLAKRGMLTVTDRRLLLHRRSRRLHLSARLDELEVIEWFAGLHSENRQQVLILRRAGGGFVRLNIDRVWQDEAQWVFDIVASFTPRPPAFLAARWVRWEGRADHDLERQLGEAAAAKAPAVA